MADLSKPAQNSVNAQRTLFDRAEQECGLSIRALHRVNNTLKVSTMEGWRDGAQMPAWAIGALGDAGIPDELLSLITEPWDRFVITHSDEEECDLDTAAEHALEFAAEVQRARSPRSPGKTAIVPQERIIIEPKRRRAAASMRRARLAA